MTAPVLADALGPRARRRVAVASAVVGLGLLGLFAVALRRFADHDQFAWDRWQPFTEAAVLRFLLAGLVNTLRVAAVAMVLASLVGAVMALTRLSRTAPLRWVAGLYVELFRALPLLMLILFSAQALPRLGVRLDLFWYLVIALVAYNGAVLGEIFRAGILSLDRGQSEAAYSVGLSYWQAMLLVVIPQAVRRMLPAIVSQLITLLKDTSLGWFIAYEELLRRGRLAGGAYGRQALQALIVVAVVYIVLCFVLSRIAYRLEVRQRRRYRASGLRVAGVEDLTVMAAAADQAAGERPR